MRPSLLPALGLLCLAALPVAAAPCGNDATGFNQWKSAFATEARSAGIRERGLAALNAARYAARTIAADRNQKSFDYSLQTFMEKRGSATIIKQGRQRRARD